MNFMNIFKYKLIMIFLFGLSLASDVDKNEKDEKINKITFKCPTIEEIHDFANKYKESNPCESYSFPDSLIFKIEKGLTFEIQIHSWEQNKNLIQRALNLTKYDETCCVDKDEILKYIIFSHSPESGAGMSLKVNLSEKNISSEDFYQTYVLPNIASTEKIIYYKFYVLLKHLLIADVAKRCTFLLWLINAPSESKDGTRYITFKNQDLKFTIYQ